MFGPRMLMGALIGGALVYLFDPDNGPERRARLRARWEANREPMMNTATAAAATAQDKVNEATAKVSEKFTDLQSKTK